MAHKKHTRRHRRIRHRGGDDGCPDGQKMVDGKCTVKLSFWQKLKSMVGFAPTPEAQTEAPPAAAAAVPAPVPAPAMPGPAAAAPAIPGLPALPLPGLKTGGRRTRRRSTKHHKRK